MSDKNLETSLQWYGFGPEDALHKIAKEAYKLAKTVANKRREVDPDFHGGWSVDPDDLDYEPRKKELKILNPSFH